MSPRFHRIRRQRETVIFLDVILTVAVLQAEGRISRGLPGKRHHNRIRRYNNPMPAASPRRQTEKPAADRPSSDRPSTGIYTAETTGLIVIALIILIVTLVRYWRFMNWGWR